VKLLRFIKLSLISEAGVCQSKLPVSPPEDLGPSLDYTTSATPLGGRCARLWSLPLSVRCERESEWLTAFGSTIMMPTSKAATLFGSESPWFVERRAPPDPDLFY
jgi:hypothetical protein